MGRNLDDIINQLPAERQAKISKLADQKIEEMIAHAATLTDFRKAVGKTQAEVAKVLGINQNAVSQLEKRSDTYVSTLRRFLQSLGMRLELSVVAENGTRIDLPNFQPWEQDDGATSAATPVKTPTRKVVAKAAPRTAAKKITTTRKRSATSRES